MKHQDIKFLIVFLGTLGFLFFALDSSITGKVVQTSFCDDSGCYDFCKTQSDCSVGVCCQEQDFGICKQDCEQEFVFNPNMETESLPPYEESPTEVKDYTLLYMFLIAFTLVIGILYLKGKKLHIKV